MYVDSENEPAKKIKKIKNNDQKRMTSMQNMKRADATRTMYNASSNATITKGSKLNWKMDDIFLGFQDADDNSDFDKKTVKVF